ncbi:MAG: hypothetical protein WBR26_21250 [Candidatus Acidiferrum sp.]
MTKLALFLLVWLLVAIPTALLFGAICHFGGSGTDEFSKDLPDVYPRKP